MGVLRISIVGSNLYHQTIKIVKSLLIVVKKNGDQHESNKKAITPVRSIQHISNENTGYISPPLMQEYFQYKEMEKKVWSFVIVISFVCGGEGRGRG